MLRLSLDEFGAEVDRALAGVPESFKPYLENVVIETQWKPSRRLLQESHLGRDRLLLGIYIGHPLTRRNVDATPEMPDRIILFQRNLEQACRSHAELRAEIRKTVYHEIGHHFGLSENDLDELGYG